MPEEPNVSQEAHGNYIAQAMGGGHASIQVYTSPSSLDARAAIDRERMLRRLHRSYQELLDQSLRGLTWVELGLATRSDLVSNVTTTNLLFRLPHGQERHLAPGTSMLSAYEEAEGELLILGAPGAGKSTLLLDLAQQLVGQALADPAHPLPVILRLSSWAAQRPALADWMIEQLARTYDVPRKLSESWVTQGRLLPLLDGLDEMQEAARPACIAAINSYHRMQLTPLVVCSRQAEYEEAASQRERLVLQSAIIVQSLSNEQIEGYLDAAGPSFAGIRMALSQEWTLRELAATPLMLSVLLLTYRGVTASQILQQGTELEQQVWTDYIARQVREKGNNALYSLEWTRAWLTFLARQMHTHQQTTFYAEYLHTDWLETSKQRTAVCLGIQLPSIVLGACLSLLVSGLLGGFWDNWSLLSQGLIGIFVGTCFSWQSMSERGEHNSQPIMHRWLSLGFSTLFSVFIVTCWYITFGDADPLWLPVMGATNLLSTGSLWLFQFLLARQSSQPRSSNYPQHWYKRLVDWFSHLAPTSIWQAALVMGIGLGLGFGLNFSLSFGRQDGVGFGIDFGESCSVLVMLMGPIVAITNGPLRFAERIHWSRHILLRRGHLRQALILAGGLSLMLGLSEVLNDGPIFGLSFGLSEGLSFGLLYWTLLGFYQGMKQEHLREQDRFQFNQGIRHSLRNSLLIGLLGALLISGVSVLNSYLDVVLFNVQNMLYDMQSNLPHDEWFNELHSVLFSNLSEFLRPGIWPIVLIVFPTGAVLMWALSGGTTVLRHYVIRWLLARSRTFPFRAQAFLDDATTRVLLQRVGGGYSFIHRRLQGYFASGGTPSPKEVPPVSARSDPPLALSSTPELDFIHGEEKASLPVPSRETRFKKKTRIATFLVVIVLLETSLLYVGVGNSLQRNLDARVRATASANAATATAIASTVQAKVNTTAEARASISPIAYPPHNTSPVLNDPLQDNSKGYQWEVDNLSKGNCKFINQAYDINTKGLEWCSARATDFTNFIYEVQMKITKGDGGGIIFRADPANEFNSYSFAINQNGSYSVHAYNTANGFDTMLAQGSNQVICQGLNQTNLVAAVVRGNIIELYVNHKRIAVVGSSTYTHGRIGVIVAGDRHQTEVIFQNAKVWKV